MKKVLFIIHLDKFTENFVKFFINEFKNIDSKFIIVGTQSQFTFSIDYKDIVFFNSYKEINKGMLAYKWAIDTDEVIFSGLFGAEKLLLKLPKTVIKKTYFQFWGGDFYDLKKMRELPLKARISMQLKKHYIRNVKGVINLIPGDYEKLCQICIPKGEHFVAPVSGNGSQVRLVKNIRCNKENRENGEIITVLVGNSATESNQHSEAFRILEKFKSENIRIICPLSYGDTLYAETVVKLGTSIFEDKFLALTNYMDREAYYHVLSEVDVAIFNNNRQQAMANISVTLGLGCKVYIRSDTSMWQTYSNERNYVIFKVEDISHLGFSEFYNFSDEDKEHNFRRYLEVSDLKCVIDAWKAFFDATLN